MRERLEFECWQCKEPFSLLVDIEGDGLLLVECPFCSERCEVDLNPYRDSTVDVIRGEGEGADIEEFKRPKRIPTQKPVEE